jgi:hypothetical protein
MCLSRFTFDLQPIGVVDQTIQNGTSYGGIAHLLASGMVHLNAKSVDARDERLRGFHPMFQALVGNESNRLHQVLSWVTLIVGGDVQGEPSSILRSQLSLEMNPSQFHTCWDRTEIPWGKEERKLSRAPAPSQSD